MRIPLPNAHGSPRCQALMKCSSPIIDRCCGAIPTRGPYVAIFRKGCRGSFGKAFLQVNSQTNDLPGAADSNRQMTMQAMKPFIIITAAISIASGLSMQVPSVSRMLMPSEQQGMVLHLFGAMAVFLGIMLILCARDLRRRGALVMWEGILRLFGCGIMVGFGLSGNAGPSAVISGLCDGMIGIAYLILLPRHVGVSFTDLLLDRAIPDGASQAGRQK